MKKFELHGNAASLIFHEGTGEYRIATSSFLLAGCKPLLRLNGKEVSFGHWSVTEHTKNSMVASAKGNAGNWTLKFGFAAGDALTLRLSGCLKKVCDDVELLYFDGLKMKADHLLSQGIKMGGCARDSPGQRNEEGFLRSDAASRDGKRRTAPSLLSAPLRVHAVFLRQGGVRRNLRFQDGSRHQTLFSEKVCAGAATLRTGDGLP